MSKKSWMILGLVLTLCMSPMAMKTAMADPAEECVPVPDMTACVNYAVGRAGVFDTASLAALGSACRGNFGADCVQFVVERTGVFAAKDIATLAQSCSGVFNVSCVSSLVNRAGVFDLASVAQLAGSCKQFQ